jgi:hypothetical protein
MAPEGLLGFANPRYRRERASAGVRLALASFACACNHKGLRRSRLGPVCLLLAHFVMPRATDALPDWYQFATAPRSA